MMEFKIDKTKWDLVTFGQIAVQLKGTVNRENSALKYYVRGEHMQTEDFHIREFGELSDEYLGPAFIRHFKKDDILYGSRRTYLKKVAIAHFEGITSNTTFVIDAVKNKIDKRLIPFIMLSNGFTEHSIMNSKGSVNPYINWKDLANYELFLPPKEQQAELADLLWALDDVIEKDLELLEKLEKYKSTFIENYFNDKNKNLIKVSLKEIATLNKYSLTNKTDENYEFSYVDLSSIQPRILLETQKILFKNSPSRARRIVKDNSIIISTVRPYQLCNILIQHNNSEYVASTGTAVINLKPEIDTKLVFEQFFTKKYIKFIEDRMTGTNYPAITARDLEDFEIFIYKSNDSKSSFENWSNDSDNSQSILKSKIQSSKDLQKSLINQLF